MSDRVTSKVVVVCKGNICRSPVAAAFINELGSGRTEARSRGLRNWHVGKSAHRRMLDVARNAGMDLSPHRAKQFSEADAAWCDHIVVVDRSTHDELVQSFGHGLSQKILFLDSNEDEIADPYDKDQQAYRECYCIIKRDVEALVGRLLCQNRSD